MIFTFGFGQRCGCGRSLRDCFTELPTPLHMTELWGPIWAWQYLNEKEAGVRQFGLRRIVTDLRNPACRCGGAGRDPWNPSRSTRELT